MSFDAVITGGIGFIGSNLAIHLAASGKRVLLVDSLDPKYGGNLHNLRTSQYYDSGQIVANISDVRDHHSLRVLLKDAPIIFNLAGQTSHMDSMIDPCTDLEINCDAQLKLLEVCREVSPSAMIIFASTRQIYGVPQYIPVDEAHPINPVDVNGINKFSGESYHRLYGKLYALKTISLRLTNTYGPRMRIKDARQTFLGVWINCLISKTPFEVWGGHQIRDYTYVDDCITAMLSLCNSRALTSDVYNVGGYTKPLTLIDTANLLVDAALELGLNIADKPFTVVQYPPDRKRIDIGDYYADDSRLRIDTGWKPAISIKEGLKRTLEFFSINYQFYQ